MNAPAALVRPPAADGTRFELAAEERCDRCGARAFVATAHRVDGHLLTLAWCSHHFTEYERSGRLSGGDVVVDLRGQLVPQPRGQR